MKLGTRLLLTLLPTTALIMAAYAGWALAEREDRLTPQLRQEVQAYATALGLAFDRALREAQRADVQALLTEVTRAPAVYAILVYDSAGARTLASDPARILEPAPSAMLQRVLSTGATVTFEREIDGERVYSVLRALQAPAGRVTGALEVAQPLASIDAVKAQVRRRFILNTLTLLLALTVLTLWLVRRVVARPMHQLVEAARAVGGGQLGHRIGEPPGGGELAELAREFNGMAESLEQTRAAVAREGEERLALERRLREAEKLAAIGNLAAGLAHEIAAPLNVISGRAEMMLRREPELPARQQHLTIIVQQIRRITTIVRNLLDFAKRREPRLRPMPLDDAVASALELLGGELTRAGVEVRREGACPSPVLSDPDLIHQVIVNLVLNAVQAMEATEGPRVLTLRLDQPATPAGEPPQACLEVQDTGPGMSEEVLASIFQPFYTTKSRGTGLGLVVARRIAEEHGGALHASSTPGGAVFRLFLPVAATEAVGAADA